MERPPQDSGYPPQNPGHPPQNPPYPPQDPGYLSQNPGNPLLIPPYPPQGPGYPPQNPGHPPKNPPYPPQDPGYLSQNPGNPLLIPPYPPQGPGYPPQNLGDPPLNPPYPPQDPGYSPNYGFLPAPKDGCNPGYPSGHGEVPQNPGKPFTPPPQEAALYVASDAEDLMQGGIKAFDFSEKSIRRGFIRKVYAIVMLQLLITIGFITLFVYHAPTKKWVEQNPFVIISSIVVTLVVLIAMACCSNVRRQAPMNYILLILFTFGESILVAAGASYYQPEAVLMAAAITAVVCFALTIFAFQTKWDFTLLNGVLFVALIILLVFSIVTIFYKGEIITIIFSSLGAVIFSVYLVYDTQLMMGGKHKYSISPEEYIFAALNIYLDIINIFVYILRIIGASGR